MGCSCPRENWMGSLRLCVGQSLESCHPTSSQGQSTPCVLFLLSSHIWCSVPHFACAWSLVAQSYWQREHTFPWGPWLLCVTHCWSISRIKQPLNDLWAVVRDHFRLPPVAEPGVWKRLLEGMEQVGHENFPPGLFLTGQHLRGRDASWGRACEDAT